MPRIGARYRLAAALAGVQSIVHLAARVHVMKDRSDDPLREFREVNIQGTANFAEQAASAGVRRFVFLSSIKVNGEITAGVAFSRSGRSQPQAGHTEFRSGKRSRSCGRSRANGARSGHHPTATGLRSRCQRKSCDYCVWLTSGVPLPFANAENRRSLIGLENLVDFIARALEHPKAVGETFLIADGQDVSTGELVRAFAAGMQKPCRIFPIPKGGSRNSC